MGRRCLRWGMMRIGEVGFTVLDWRAGSHDIACIIQSSLATLCWIREGVGPRRNRSFATTKTRCHRTEVDNITNP